MPIGTAIATTAISTGGALYGQSQANKAAGQAIDAQTAAADRAAQVQWQMYNQGRTDQLPWLTTGSSALGRIAQIYGLDSMKFNPGQAQQGGGVGGGINPHGGDGVQPNAPAPTPTPATPQAGPDYSSFYQSPDYLFRLQQGLAGVTAGSAARGMLDSGATRKAEIKYAGNLASGEYNNYLNRLFSLAGIGQTSAAQQGQAGQGYAGAIGGVYQRQGDNLASSYLGRGASNANMWGNIGGQVGSLISNVPWGSFGGSGGGLYGPPT